jgi:hypothetical protein
MNRIMYLQGGRNVVKLRGGPTTKGVEGVPKIAARWTLDRV